MSAFESALLTIQLGNTISNAPKNDAAKNINITKNNIFGIQWVDSQLNISAVTDSPPKKYVTKIIAAIGTVYRIMIDRPNTLAKNLDLALSSPLFMKNETVIGTIGKTHGVRSAAKPQSIASIINPQIELLSFVLVC